MLDLQRQRSSGQSKANASFTRLIIVAHLLGGVVAAGMLFSLGLITPALVTILWYLLSIALIAGMCHMLQWCRIMLGLWFLVASITVFIFIAQSPLGAARDPQAVSDLSRQLLPLWLSTYGAAYFVGGAVILFSPKIESATARGFSVWRVTERL